jgi:hypothetical protein
METDIYDFGATESVSNRKDSEYVPYATTVEGTSFAN